MPAGTPQTGRRPLRPPPPASAPILHVEPAALNFGTVWEDPRFEWAVPVHNPGPAAVVVERWQASCNCLGVSPDALRLEPGETRSVTVRIDLGDKVGPSTAPVPVAVGFAPVVGGRVGPAWTVEGVARPLLAAPPPDLVVVASDAGPRFQAVRFDLSLAVPAAELTATTDQPIVRCEPVLAADGRAVALNLTADATAPHGTRSFVLDLTGRFAPAGPAFRKRLTGAVSVVPDLRASPTEVAVAGLAAGEVREETVAFASVSGRPVCLIAATAPDGVPVAVHVDGPDQLRLVVRRPPDEAVVRREVVVAYFWVGIRVRAVPVAVTIVP
ncbi:MAG: DUF1573 domain-containing protein [Gemmataceae bacterium]|nr:DUF1573 domain-containing protein [Gemmataceae bacterium]